MDTYMGDKFTTPEQRVEHFKWCWNATMLDLANENIHLNNTKDLYNYFEIFMLDTFYLATDKGDIENTKDNLTKLWKYILSYSTNKTRSDVDTFLEVYKMFEKTLEN